LIGVAGNDGLDQAALDVFEHIGILLVAQDTDRAGTSIVDQCFDHAQGISDIEADDSPNSLLIFDQQIPDGLFGGKSTVAIDFQAIEGQTGIPG